MPKPFYTYKQFYFKQFSLAWVRSFNVKTILFQTVQFSVSTQFSSIWLIDRTLSGATTLSPSGLGCNSNKWVPRISQCSSITGTTPSDCLVSSTGHLFGESSSSADMQSLYSTAPADWARNRVNNIAFGSNCFAIMLCNYFKSPDSTIDFNGMSRVIFCLKVRELRILYIPINIFCSCYSGFFLHIWYHVFLLVNSNGNEGIHQYRKHVQINQITDI